MAKPESWRLDPANYPFTDVIAPRFRDLDTHGHINNVAMSAMFETSRVRFNRTMIHHKRDDQRWLLAAITLNYLEEAYFPADITFVTGVGHVGTRSWTILSAAFQEGQCVATSDSTLVVTGALAHRFITDEFREALERQKINPPA